MRVAKVLAISILVFLVFSSIAFSAPKVRIKDIARIEDRPAQSADRYGFSCGLKRHGGQDEAYASDDAEHVEVFCTFPLLRGT